MIKNEDYKKMSYYDDNGKYVGFDPIEYAEEHKIEVPTTQELLKHIYYRCFIEKSKEYINEPVCDDDDFMSVYMYGFNKIIYDSFGSPVKSLELIAKDSLEHLNEFRIIHTNHDHMVPIGTDTWIVYQNKEDGGVEVIGVFYDEEYANQFIKGAKKQKSV